MATGMMNLLWGIYMINPLNMLLGLALLAYVYRDIREELRQEKALLALTESLNSLHFEIKLSFKSFDSYCTDLVEEMPTLPLCSGEHALPMTKKGKVNRFAIWKKTHWFEFNHRAEICEQTEGHWEGRTCGWRGLPAVWVSPEMCEVKS
jgi:hypothetical protein